MLQTILLRQLKLLLNTSLANMRKSPMKPITFQNRFFCQHLLRILLCMYTKKLLSYFFAETELSWYK